METQLLDWIMENDLYPRGRGPHKEQFLTQLRDSPKSLHSYFRGNMEEWYRKAMLELGEVSAPNIEVCGEMMVKRLKQYFSNEISALPNPFR